MARIIEDAMAHDAAPLAMNAVGSVGFYLCFVFVTTYLRQTEHMVASNALDISTLAVFIQIGTFRLAPALSDRSEGDRFY
ncbi:hypothetical protein PQQ86_32535 [Paraburkholderia sediminicola]|uniref:hypothetical protein n=1 Tax=Paraburkholderia sediminicola TaxID=458836 RepID=UPI0038B6DE79